MPTVAHEADTETFCVGRNDVGLFGGALILDEHLQQQ